MYDTKCYDCAEHMLPSGTPPELVSELAQQIQDTAETFITFGEHSAELAKLETVNG